jgi:CRISPR-associated protein Csd2
MGMKHRVDEGIYVFFGSMNPQQSKKTGFNDGDALVLKLTLPKLFENDSSSARPEGSMQVLKLLWWEQDGYGTYSSARVHRTLKVNDDGSYTLSNLDGLKPEEIDGF